MTPGDRQKLVESLFRHEGLRLKVYDDATGKPIGKGSVVQGYPTIGVGRNLVGRGITDGEARVLLENDINVVTEELDKIAGWWRALDSVRQCALIELCFNMGTANFINGWPNTIAALREGRYAEVARSLRTSKWARQVKGRSEVIAGLMERGAWS